MISPVTDIVMTSAMLLNLPQVAGALQAACAEASVPEPFVIAPPELSNLPPTFPKIFQPLARVQLEISLTLGAAGQSPPHAAPKTAASAGAGGGSHRLSPPRPDEIVLTPQQQTRIADILLRLNSGEKKPTAADELEAVGGDPIFDARLDYRARCFQAALGWLLERELCGDPVDRDQINRLSRALGHFETVIITPPVGLPDSLSEKLSEAGISKPALAMVSSPPKPKLVGIDPAFFLGGKAAPVTSPSLEAVNVLSVELARYSRIDKPIPGLVGPHGELLLASWQAGEDGEFHLVPVASNINGLRFVAAGGMGIVFVGEELLPSLESEAAPPLPVAVKVIKKDLASDLRLRKRFFLEEWVGRLLRHRHVLTVRGIAWTRDGRPVMIMPYLRGWMGNPSIKDLESLLREGPLDIGMAVEDIFMPIVEGLAYAHETGVIHRDLKPANIFIDREGDRHIFRLGDFGMALLVNTPALNFDRPGSVPGTPSYMSDEAWRGNFSAASDLFAIGVTLYETLTGKRPIDTTSHRGNYAALPRLWLHEVARPSEIRPEISPELEEIIFRAMGMARNPFRSAREFYSALFAWRESRNAHREAQTDLESARSLAKAARNLYQPAMDAAAFQTWRRKMEEAIARCDVALGKLKGYDKAAEAERWKLLWNLFEASEKFGEEDLIAPRLAHHPLYADWVKTPGELAVDVSGEARDDLAVEIVSYKDDDGVFREWKSERFDRFDTLPKTLPKGIYALRISGGGVVPMQIPFLIRRGEKTELKFRLYSKNEVPEGFAVVPAGEVITDAEPHFYGSRSEKIETVEQDLAVKKTLVTNGEYIAWLNELIEWGFLDAAELHVPRDGSGRPLWHAETIAEIRRGKPISDRIYFATAGSNERDVDVPMDAPVIWVSAQDADAYADWYSTPEQKWEIPTRAELLRISRGNDARARPWGSRIYLEGAANVRRTGHIGEMYVSPVGNFSLDRSPFSHPAGVISDVIGNVRAFTSSEVEREDGRHLRLSVGSGFNQDAGVNIADAWGFEAGRTLPHGFRVVLRLKRENQ